MKCAWLGTVLLLVVVAGVQATDSTSDEVFLNLPTRWYQRDAYAVFSPVDPSTGQPARLGCWSVALAQILFYHHLSPHGDTSYQSLGTTVAANFDAAPVDLGLVAVDLRAAGVSPAQCQATARYLWYAALVTGKDFGTGTYIGNSDVRRERLARHFALTTRRLRSDQSSTAEIEAFIRAELQAGRPLLLYVEGSSAGEEGSGHALVIDGCRGSGALFETHCNLGWGGRDDGWYRFWQPIVTSLGTFNQPERWVLAVRPATAP